MNRAKTKIIAILAAVTVILSSCSSKTNEQPNVSSTPSSSISTTAPKDNIDNEKQSINSSSSSDISTVTPEKNEDNKTSDLKEETYKGEELTILSVYNPLEEKENYFFVKMEPMNILPTPKETFLKAFENTPLEDAIANDTAETFSSTYYYNSVLDNNVTYMLNFTTAESDEYSSVRISQTLFTEDINYHNLYQDLNSKGITLDTYHTSFAVSSDNTTYYEKEDTEEAKSKYNITLQNFIGTVTWNENTEYTKSELQEMQDALNKGKTLQRTNEN